MDRLLREGNPPAGQLASPKPQYKDVQTNNWEELKGEGGASYVKDKDVFAKLEQARALLDAISGKDFATQTTLAAVLAKLADLESELATIKANQLSGDQKVQLKGSDIEIPVSSPHDSMFFPLGYEDVIIPVGGSGAWDEHIREIGNVVYRPGFSEQYVLVYTGHQGVYTEDNVSIGLATSSDGKTWTKKGPLNLGRAAEDPYLVYYDGMFYLYVEDKEVNPARNIRLYTSTDLSTWLDRGDVLHYEPGTWEAYDVSSPVVWIDEGVWYMLYEGRRTVAGGATGLAISTDGINWQKHPDNPVITAVDAKFSAPYTISWASGVVPNDVVKIGDITYATVHVYMGNRWVPGVLWSTDNVKWWDYLRKPMELPLESGVSTVMFSRYGFQDHVIYARDGVGILQLPIVGFRNRHLPVPLYDPGRRLEPFYLVKDVEVRSTSEATTRTVDISRYRSLEIWVRSTLDQPITLAPTIALMGIAATGLRQYVDGEWQTVTIGKLVIPVHADWHPLSSAWPWLNNLLKVDRFRLRYMAQGGAPTTGSLTILAVGEV